MLKRAFDIVFSACWLVGFAPLLLVVAILVRLKLGSPVLFIQERPGLRARPFRMVKFRTMTDARGPDGELLPDEVRLTSFGKFLRATTLDEFPEMWNVLVRQQLAVGPALVGHGAKLDHAERPAAETGALLDEEHGRAELEAHE